MSKKVKTDSKTRTKGKKKIVSKNGQVSKNKDNSISKPELKHGGIPISKISKPYREFMEKFSGATLEEIAAARIEVDEKKMREARAFQLDQGEYRADKGKKGYIEYLMIRDPDLSKVDAERINKSVESFMLAVAKNFWVESRDTKWRVEDKLKGEVYRELYKRNGMADALQQAAITKEAVKIAKRRGRDLGIDKVDADDRYNDILKSFRNMQKVEREGL